MELDEQGDERTTEFSFRFASTISVIGLMKSPRRASDTNQLCPPQVTTFFGTMRREPANIKPKIKKLKSRKHISRHFLDLDT